MSKSIRVSLTTEEAEFLVYAIDEYFRQEQNGLCNHTGLSIEEVVECESALEDLKRIHAAIDKKLNRVLNAATTEPQS